MALFVNLRQWVTLRVDRNDTYGNLSMHNFAGRDRTAIASNWFLYLLTAYTEVQDWVREDFDGVLGERDDKMVSKEYSDLYPKLSRCQALLCKVLRIITRILSFYFPLTLRAVVRLLEILTLSSTRHSVFGTLF